MNALVSGSLLAASMLLGQATEPPAGGGKSAVPPPPTMQPTQPTQPTQRPVLGWLNREDRPILHKIQGWFKKDPQPEPPPGSRGVIRETPTPTPVNPAPGSNDFYRKLPNPTSKATAPGEIIVTETKVDSKQVQQASLKQPANDVKSPILSQLASRIGRDEKFEWVTGQLEIENGAHVLYYATPETVDPYHGRIVLQPQQVDLSKFRRGDLISVRGQIVQRQTPQGMAPAYRITMASLIERPKL